MGLRVRIQASAGARAALAAAALELPRDLLGRAARLALRGEGVREAELSLTLLADDDIVALNEQYLQHEGPTDVISFALFQAPEPPLGDIYIGVEQALRQAAVHAVAPAEELVRLAAHGALHVLGYDHPVGAARLRSPMWQLQERIVAEVMA